jgi:gluconate 2-dehydrogenase gamma chain
VAVASVVQIPFAGGTGTDDDGRGQISSLQSELRAAKSQVASLNGQVATLKGNVSELQSQVSTLSQPTALQFFNEQEQPLVEALAEAMIPSDSTGPGAKEAGVIYFIDGQLAGEYGNNANMYLAGPYIQPGHAGPITVDGITYSAGSAPARLTAGGGYQYPITWQEFWRNCLQWTEAYSNSAYGGNFEALSPTQQAQILTDLWNSKPTNFNGISSQAWFSELHDMVWAGFFTDPLYGGNQNMVGWEYIGFTGTNQGNAYGEGYTTSQLMVMSKPVRLKPQSLAQFEASVGELTSVTATGSSSSSSSSLTSSGTSSLSATTTVTTTNGA